MSKDDAFTVKKKEIKLKPDNNEVINYFKFWISVSSYFGKQCRP